MQTWEWRRSTNKNIYGNVERFFLPTHNPLLFFHGLPLSKDVIKQAILICMHVLYGPDLNDTASYVSIFVKLYSCLDFALILSLPL